MKLSLTYADIALVPYMMSSIAHRDTGINLTSPFLGKAYKLPVLSAPMKTVTGSRMARKLLSMGILPVLMRTEDAENDYQQFLDSAEIPGGAAVSIGATGDYLERAAEFIQLGARIICIDTANGFHATVGNAINQLRKSRVPIKIIAGNVGSVEGYAFLHKLGVDAVRVGIGNGSVCTTSIQTGVGMGQVTLLQEIAQYRFSTSLKSDSQSRYTPAVIADGGITEPGDMCKALVLGADVVMCGSFFAGTLETPGDVVLADGSPVEKPTVSGLPKFKLYAGEASRAVKGDAGKHVEGTSTMIRFKGPVEEQVEALEEGLRSSMSYMNCTNLVEFGELDTDRCVVQLSHNARIERTPHLLYR